MNIYYHNSWSKPQILKNFNFLILNETICMFSFLVQGVEPSLRNTLWKYLLNFYPWTSSSDECHEIYKKKIEEYCVMKRQWQTITPGQEMRFSSYRERKNLIG